MEHQRYKFFYRATAAVLPFCKKIFQDLLRFSCIISSGITFNLKSKNMMQELYLIFFKETVKTSSHQSYPRLKQVQPLFDGVRRLTGYFNLKANIFGDDRGGEAAFSWHTLCTLLWWVCPRSFLSSILDRKEMLRNKKIRLQIMNDRGPGHDA